MSKSKLDRAATSSRGHNNPSPTQTKKPDGGSSPSSTGSMESDEVAVPCDATKVMLKIHTIEEAWACLLAVQLIDPEDPMAPDMLGIAGWLPGANIVVPRSITGGEGCYMLSDAVAGTNGAECQYEHSGREARGPNVG